MMDFIDWWASDQGQTVLTVLGLFVLLMCVWRTRKEGE